MDYKDKKVVIGISGGVDSAVSCYLLKNSPLFRNLSVEGAFMQNWDDFLFGNKLKSSNCNQLRDWKDAKKVSKFTNVKITKVDFIKEYWKEVFLELISDMKKGLTPNPDIICNKNIKFSYFFNLAKENMQADYVATGHYAGIEYNSKKKKYYLVKCKDQEKDQTYFLCSININILPYLIFPISELNKSEVRQIAREVKIPNAKKKDSTGVCFIGEDNFSSFISNFLEKKSGDIVDICSMKKVGNHNGHYFFTIGQRKGLSISGNKLPYYVVSKDVKQNKVYVSDNNLFLYSNWCFTKNMNWLVSEDEVIDYSRKVITAKFRHRQKEVEATFSLVGGSNSVKISLCQPIRAITPGQFAVLYYDQICIGGGDVFLTEKLNSECNFQFK